MSECVMCNEWCSADDYITINRKKINICDDCIKAVIKHEFGSSVSYNYALSEKGRDFDGNMINSDKLTGYVYWKNGIYKVGNSGHGLVDLHLNGDFINCVRTSKIRLVRRVRLIL